MHLTPPMRMTLSSGWGENPVPKMVTSRTERCFGLDDEHFHAESACDDGAFSVGLGELDHLKLLYHMTPEALTIPYGSLLPKKFYEARSRTEGRTEFRFVIRCLYL